MVGMDVTMARILSQGLFDDPTKVEFVKQDPAARIRTSPRARWISSSSS